MRISRRAQRVEASGIRKMFDLASRLEDPLDFSIGQPDFGPPEAAVEAAVRAIREGHNRYTVTEGLPALNEAVLDLVEGRTGVRPEGSLITAGVAGGLALSFLTLLEKDQQALIPDPYFVCYDNLLEMVAAGPAFYDIYPDFRVTEERLEAGMNERVGAVLVNSPSNPTGRTLEAEELDAVARFAARHDLPVISDEIYDLFSFEGPAPSMLGRYDQTILLGGFSKTFGVPGWRLGFAVGDARVIDKMRTLQQFSFVCAPAPLQHGALAGIGADLSEHVDAYRRKRDILYESLQGTYDLVRPTGAFYAFPRVPGGLSGEAFSELAVQRNLLLVPGAAFSRRDSHFRLSFAMPDEKIRRGCEVLVDLGAEAERAAEAAG